MFEVNKIITVQNDYCIIHIGLCKIESATNSYSPSNHKSTPFTFYFRYFLIDYYQNDACLPLVRLYSNIKKLNSKILFATDSIIIHKSSSNLCIILKRRISVITCTFYLFSRCYFPINNTIKTR